jgi:LacI family transcriptional regulator
MNGRSKIEDVARHAGVSPRTVSRVVNDLPNVSRKAREAVELAISELDFRPHFAARALASSRSFFIGIISPNIDSDYFRGLYSMLITECREKGYYPIIEQVSGSDEAIIEQITRSARDVQFAGLVLLSYSPQIEALDAFSRAANIPMVAITSNTPHTGGFTIQADEAQGEVLLADYFWSGGHRTFGVGCIGVAQFTRGTAFRNRLIALGADPSNIIEYPVDWHYTGLEAGRRLGTDVMRGQLRPTAVFALNDEVAAGAIGHFHSIGMDVPADISVAGFDDSSVAQATWPTLTTVRQPIKAMAQAAIEWLIDDQRQSVPALQTLPVELVVRGSTGPYPRSTAPSLAAAATTRSEIAFKSSSV